MGWADDMWDDAFRQAEAIHNFANSPVGQALRVVRAGGDAAADIFITQHQTLIDYAEQIRNLKLRIAELGANCAKSS